MSRIDRNQNALPQQGPSKKDKREVHSLANKVHSALSSISKETSIKKGHTYSLNPMKDNKKVAEVFLKIQKK